VSTLLEIQQAVQRQFGDDTEAQITLTDIRRWANEGLLKIARETDALLDTTTIASIIGTSEYVLPADFLRVDRVAFDGVPLIRTTSQDLDMANPSRNVTPVIQALPTRFYIRRKRVILYPAPDRVKNITVEYTARPNELVNAADVPEIPVEYHQDIIRFALSRAYELDGERTDAQTAMQEFNEGVGLARSEIDQPYTDSYPMIREV
jgi:hypothetical protein